ncbi:MAG: polyprenol monophosphomannose synthase [Anaerolineae bacterium]
MRVAVILPTYNERENLPPIAGEILAQEQVDHLIVVDDNSPDGTGELADELAEKDPRIVVVHRPGKQGLGRAYVAGFRRAMELGADVIITMDADFSHHPRYIPAMLAKLDMPCDIVIGSRYVPGGGTRHWGLERQFLSAGANMVARLSLGLRAHDCTAGFRAYRRHVLESIPLDNIRSNGYSFLVEMLYRCQQAGFRVGEVPIIFEDRQRGESKISREEIYKAMLTVFRLALDRLARVWRRPAVRGSAR